MILLLAMLAVGAAHAQPPDGQLIEYTVRRGDTCAGIARRLYGDSRRIDLLHRHNPQLGPTPHHLAAGSVLRLPRPAPTGGPDARLSSMRNHVEARAPDGGAWRPARRGMELDRGAQVTTYEESSAEITFRDRSVVQMRERTLLIVFGGTRRLARQSTHATLERGALRSRMDELAGRVEVETPSTAAAFEGGVAVVSVDDDGTSRVVSHEGAATVGTGSERMSIPAGTGTLVRPGARPTPPRPLPPPPTWAIDLSGRFIGLTGRGGTLRARWLPVEDALRYRIEVARNPDGTDLAAAVEVPATTNEVEVHRIPQGVYYLSVATIDRERFEGRRSPLRAMQVLEARIVPPGGVEPVTAPFDPGDPSVPFSPPEVLPGTWIVPPIGFRCADGDGEPRDMITLGEVGHRSLRCVDARDRDVPAFDVRVLEVEAATVPEDLVLPRGARTRVALILPEEAPVQLVATAPRDADVTVDRLVRRGPSHWMLGLTPGPDAPEELAIELGVPAGTELVRLATVRLRIAPRAGAPARPVRPVEPPPPPPLPVQDAVALVPMLETLPLLDDARTGLSAFTSVGVSGARPLDGEPLLRLTAGVEAQLFDEPVRLGASYSVDPIGEHALVARRGHGDVRMTVAFTATLSRRLRLTADVGLLAPTGAADNDVGHVVVLQSVRLTAHPHRRVTLRARQGAVFGAAEDASLLWASAYGIDVSPVDWLALGVELDLSLGRGADGIAHAPALGAGALLRLGPLDVALGVRAALNADARRVMGPWLLAASLRLSYDP